MSVEDGGLRRLTPRQDEPDEPASDTVKRALQAVRSHLGMQVAYVSQIVGEDSVFQVVDAPGLEALIKAGDSRKLQDVYCRHILAGRLPELIPDTSAEPLAMSMPITSAVPIGAHMSVPIRLPGGRTYGMFCCLSSKADPSLNERDLQMMKAFADLAAFEISRDLEATQERDRKLARTRAALAEGQFSIAYQPIWDIAGARLSGFECLTRFSPAPVRSPDKWFDEAAEVGMGVELEIAAIKAALLAGSRLPDDIYLAVNASPQTILSAELPGALAGLTTERIVLEVTEHAPVSDYAHMRRALQPLREDGLRLAVDDAGAGYSSLQHILHLKPDLIKLDMTLTRDIDRDPARRALASALIVFARETGGRIIAEGVETESELATLRFSGVQFAQGYHLGRPMPLEEAAMLAASPLLRVA